MAITYVENELIAVNAVSGTIIADNAITAVHIAQNAVTATQIPAGSITTGQLAADAVSGAKLADSSVVTANIQDDQVTGDKLTDNITIAGTLGVTSNATVGGTLGVTGETTLSTHLNMGDSDIIKLGASADLQIQHDASNSYITDAGTGALKLRGSVINIDNADSSKGMATLTDGGSVALFYNDSKKFETTNTGTDVTGTLDVEGAYATNVPGVTVNNTSNTSWQQGIHVLNPNISAGTSTKEVAGISVGTEWDSYNAAKLGFYYAGDGSASNLLTLGLHGRDKAMTVAAGTGNVGIGKGTTVAAYDLDVDGDINFTGTLREDGSAFSSGVTTLAALTTATVSSSDPAVDTNPSAVGHLWVNSSSGEVYICTTATSGSNVWTNIGDGTGHIATATGGNSIANVTISSQAYRVHVFTSTGNFVCGALDDIDILMVAGGGSGGVRHGGGGGAGGMIEITDTTFSSGTYVCTVGDGGARKVGNGAGTDGTDSTIVCSARSVSITAEGGGGGAGLAATTGRDGGSGGGAGPYHENASLGLGDATQGTPSMTGLTGGSGAGFGYDGGGNPGNHAAGGGGGAGAVGGNSIDESGGEGSDTGGAGGAGRQNNIDGNNYYYAAGGGGGGRRAFHGGAGGIGGGGGGAAEYLHSGTDGVGGTSARTAGANADDDVAGSGGANTGSGGGGIAQAGTEGYPASSGSDSVSGAGGSGIIIIRYEV